MGAILRNRPPDDDEEERIHKIQTQCALTGCHSLPSEAIDDIIAIVVDVPEYVVAFDEFERKNGNVCLYRCDEKYSQKQFAIKSLETHEKVTKDE